MKSFDSEIRVRFGHSDPAGIAYYPRIFEYVHVVTEELWERHVGVRYDTLVRDERVGFPLVHTEVDFHSPLHFGDRARVRVTCFRLGRSSLGLRFRFEREGTLAAEARMTTVCTELATMKSRPIADAWRARLLELAEPDAAVGTRSGLGTGSPSAGPGPDRGRAQGPGESAR